MLALRARCAIAIFLLLQAAFGGWRLAVLAFLTLPVALAGGVLAALIDGAELSLGSLIGFLALFGIAARNGLVLIRHFQDLERDEGESFGADLVQRGARGAARADPDDRRGPMALVALPFVMHGLPAGPRGRAPDGGRDPGRARDDDVAEPVRAARRCTCASAPRAAGAGSRGGARCTGAAGVEPATAEARTTLACATAGAARCRARRPATTAGHTARQRAATGAEKETDDGTSRLAAGCGRCALRLCVVARGPCRSRPARRSRRSPRPATSREARADQGQTTTPARDASPRRERRGSTSRRRGPPQPGGHKVVPLRGADLQRRGKTFVYTSPKPLSYVRAPVTVRSRSRATGCCCPTGRPPAPRS